MKKILLLFFVSVAFSVKSYSGCTLLTVPCISGIGFETYCVNAGGGSYPCWILNMDCGDYRTDCLGVG